MVTILADNHEPRTLPSEHGALRKNASLAWISNKSRHYH